jgi:hypothetical protein
MLYILSYLVQYMYEVVITLDFESSIPGSNPGERTTLFLLHFAPFASRLRDLHYQNQWAPLLHARQATEHKRHNETPILLGFLVLHHLDVRLFFLFCCS